MSDEKPNPNEPHVFQEVMVPPVSQPRPGLPGGGFVGPPPTPMAVAAQCGLCRRGKDDRLHLAAEANDAPRWPL